MQFQSLTYLCFLVFAVSIYWFLNVDWRKVWLFIASFLFYAWYRVDYSILLLLVICNHFFLTRHALRFQRAWVGYLSVVLSLLLLVFFKYTNMIIHTLNQLVVPASGKPFAILDLILPLGISFFVFQSISYTVDCLRDPTKESEHFFDFALYIVFWPQLVAGPVMRAQELIPQFQKQQRFCFYNLKEGCKRILEGLFLKLVLADRLAFFVNEGFQTYQQNTLLDNWSLCFAFGFQIYFDFAGYSSIAIGSALLLGYQLTENFDFPYASKNPREFWKRWHISLSSWIRDYLYLPLMNVTVRASSSQQGIEIQDAKKASSQKWLALVASWSIMGLWHGANWTFLLWGLWHAVVILLYRFFFVVWHSFSSENTSSKTSYFRFFSATSGVIVTILLIMPSWLFFRALTVRQAFHMLFGLFQVSSIPRLSYTENYYIVLFLIVVGFFITYLLSEIKEKLSTWTDFVDPIRYALMLLLVVAFSDSQQQFIYFQF